MAEKTKEEELKQKLLDFFDKKLTDLTTKFEADIDSIEKMKYEYFDTVIKKFEEIEAEHKKEEEKEKEKPEKDKEKPEKKSEEPKHEKVTKKKLEKIDPTLRPKTPMPNPKKKEVKEDKAHDTTTDKHKKEAKAKPAAHPPTGGKAAAGKKADAGKKPAIPKSKTVMNKKGGAAKGGKKDAKKETKEKKEEEKKEEEHVEEKKQIILNPKYIYQVSDELKKNSNLSCLFFILKGKYLDKKNTFHIATNSPLLYKSMGSNMKYLLDDKKKEVQAKADEIEKFLNNYGDLNTYLTKEFTITKKAKQSIQFFKKKEDEEIQKMAELPKEVEMIIKCIYYFIDEPFDESMNCKQLYENLINNILSKSEDKTFKSLLDNYISHNKYLKKNLIK